MIVNKLNCFYYSDSFIERLKKACDFLESTDLASLPTGRVPIDGDELYADVQEYMTRPEEFSLYENHEKYADVQYIVSGHEMIFVTHSDNIGSVFTPYDPEKDITFYCDGSYPHHRLYMCPGDSAVFSPEDYHKTKCDAEPDKSESVKKVIVKVKL